MGSRDNPSHMPIFQTRTCIEFKEKKQPERLRNTDGNLGQVDIVKTLAEVEFKGSIPLDHYFVL